MALFHLGKVLTHWLRTRLSRGQSSKPRGRGPVSHVIILDGTMSTLEPGFETHAGMTYRLLREMNGAVSLYYEAGLQLLDWRAAPDVMMGRGINRQIRRAYGYLASRYRPGDAIFLMGYSRGAYAVRSLAGVIDQVGLIRAEHATERNIRDIYRHYQNNPTGPHAQAFVKAFCHADTPIEMIGVWDTVKALGLRVPLLWRLDQKKHDFHNHALGKSVKHGFHALALDETRLVYEPIMWTVQPDWQGRVEQVWFRGAHSDVGGQLDGFVAARPLANISLVWMLEKAQGCGLPLPEGWETRFVQSPDAQSVGTWRGFGKIFLLRRKRVVGQDRSERVHETVVVDPVTSRWSLPKFSGLGLSRS
jgi:uncharacterized protein (DUF2235 family)